MDWLKRVRKIVPQLQTYTPGKPIEEVQRELGLTEVIKLASNENPLGPSPKAIEAIKASLQEVHRYPDDSYYRLKNKLAEFWKVPKDWILLGRGSEEILLHLVLTVVEKGDEVIFSKPSFVMYEILSVLMDATCVQVPLKNFSHDLWSIADAVTNRTKLIFLDNPNNPVGTIVKHQEVLAFLDKLPEDILVVLDEAYAEFSENKDYPKTLDYILNGRSVIMLRTFSKAYGLAGLRIGYCISRPELTSVLTKVREPFNVSSIAAIAAESALDDKEFIEQVRKVVLTNKRLMYNALNELKVKYVPTEANFILIDIGRDDRRFADELMKLGVIIRPCSPLGLPNHLRVDIGTTEQVQRFIEALKKVL